MTTKNNTTKRKPITAAPATMGRKPYEPTAQVREQVRILCGMGLRDFEIAKVIGVSGPTMRKYFFNELEVGHLQANAKVAQSLFKQATDPDKPNVSAAIFWMKARAGWSDQGTPLGKKEMADALASTAHEGTGWDSLLQ